MKNILVLTDFSATAYQALFYICRLMKHRQACFHVLHTFTEQTPSQHPGAKPAGAGTLLRLLEKEALEGLSQTVHRIRLDQENPKHEFRTIARQGTLAATVAGIIPAEKIEMVVMGNKGASAIKNIFMGSNAMTIIRSNLNRPVLLVPEEVGADIPMEIAFATDYNHPYHAEVLAPLIFMAKLCSASIRIVHVNEEEKLSSDQLERLEKLKVIFGQTPHSIYWMPDFRTKTLAIHSYIEKHGIGMLAMIRHRHDFLEGLQHEPVIRKMQFLVEVPFLVLPDRT